jgi:hypothetical protein
MLIAAMIKMVAPITTAHVSSFSAATIPSLGHLLCPFGAGSALRPPRASIEAWLRAPALIELGMCRSPGPALNQMPREHVEKKMLSRNYHTTGTLWKQPAHA